MGNTGTGGNENATGAGAMAENSQACQMDAKRNTTRTGRPITPAEAAQILASALVYCRKAGIIVTGYNEGKALRLCLLGLNYDEQSHSIDVTR